MKSAGIREIFFIFRSFLHQDAASRRAGLACLPRLSHCQRSSRRIGCERIVRRSSKRQLRIALNAANVWRVLKYALVPRAADNEISNDGLRVYRPPFILAANLGRVFFGSYVHAGRLAARAQLRFVSYNTTRRRRSAKNCAMASLSRSTCYCLGANSSCVSRTPIAPPQIYRHRRSLLRSRSWQLASVCWAAGRLD
jgi:hypothetical protein